MLFLPCALLFFEVKDGLIGLKTEPADAPYFKRQRFYVQNINSYRHFTYRSCTFSRIMLFLCWIVQSQMSVWSSFVSEPECWKLKFQTGSCVCTRCWQSFPVPRTQKSLGLTSQEWLKNKKILKKKKSQTTTFLIIFQGILSSCFLVFFGSHGGDKLQRQLQFLCYHVIPGAGTSSKIPGSLRPTIKRWELVTLGIWLCWPCCLAQPLARNALCKT